MAKILLVEDDSNLREIYGARLEAEGYTVAVAADGDEGLAVAVKERPDLIIADVMMPKISGFDMLDILRSTPETKDVKVIVMTALSQEEDRERGEKLGADKYFVKSQVVLEDLVASVKELLGEAQATSAAPAVDPVATTDPVAVADPATPTASQPAPADPGASTDDQTATDNPAKPADLNNEVADFVANSPLMNGTPPTASQPTDQSTATAPADNDQPPQQ